MYREPYPEEIELAYKEGYESFCNHIPNPYNLGDHPELHEAFENGYQDALKEEEEEEEEDREND